MTDNTTPKTVNGTLYILAHRSGQPDSGPVWTGGEEFNEYAAPPGSDRVHADIDIIATLEYQFRVPSDEDNVPLAFARFADAAAQLIQDEVS